MATPSEIEAKFWKALSSDRILMLGLDGVEDGHARPMAVQFEDDRAPLWFFTSSDNTIVQKLAGGSGRAIATFSDKGHDLFATVHGTLTEHTDRATVDRLWNPHAAAWYENGKDDPKLRLLRLDADNAEIWLNESNLLAGIKSALGRDPKYDAEKNIAEVNLR